jgi:hypothetical protein
MDFNNDKNLWRYNDSTNSPYHNQPTQSPFKRDPFAYVSLLMGVIALITYCTLFIPLVCGGLSIIFAVLSYRPKKPLSPLAITGISVSCFALVTIIGLIVVSFILVQDPAYRAYALETSGIDIDAWMQQLREAYGLTGSTN